MLTTIRPTTSKNPTFFNFKPSSRYSNNQTETSEAVACEWQLVNTEAPFIRVFEKKNLYFITLNACRKLEIFSSYGSNFNQLCVIVAELVGGRRIMPES